MPSVMITGAGSGMGRAYAELLASKGWQVFAGCIAANPSVPQWDATPNLQRVACDVTNPQEIADAARTVGLAAAGKLDLLINNAGVGLASGAIEQAIMPNARLSMEVNYWGIIHMVQGFLPLLKAGPGRIINVSSPANYLTMPLGFTYVTSKAAAKSLSHHIRMELGAAYGIQVTNLEPGGVESQMIIEGRDGSSTWNSMSDDVRAIYQQHFVAGMEAMDKTVKFIPPAEFAELVYQQVILKKKWKPSYQVGPGAATISWLHKLLPESVNQAMWKHVFGKKKKGS